MILEMKMPSPGESITEVEIAGLLVDNGAYVELDEPIAEIDSDKATLELNAEQAGVITFLVEEGQTVNVGDPVATIDTSAEAPEGKTAAAEETTEPAAATAAAAAPAEQAPATAAPNNEGVKASPVAREMMNQNGVAANKVNGSGAGGKITKSDVESYLAGGFDHSVIQTGWGGSRDSESKKMSSLRRKVAQRLVAVKNETAMLTTFNEVDMSRVMAVRSKYKNDFREKYGVGLGFMSFFTKAVTEALNHFPAVNAMIDGDQMITHNYADVGIAVSTPKGLMVPVIRNAEQLALHEIEAEIKRLAIKARDGKLSIDEMTGGTFTITNGGVFGSMLSTPNINPPQSSILGMHNIVEHAIAVNGKVEVRTIMYLALSYDYRIINGKESVSFLVKVKEMIEDP
ncbi:MAG: 2-oxoglutarate dehydrogenase complex dihydrolipoyllysine-residue succinyltransferase, partial [Salibacteraceae bacterium]